MPTRELIDLHATEGADRVRVHTEPEVQARLDEELVSRLALLAAQAELPSGRAVLSQRLAELEQETDIERALEINASLLAFTGTMLAAFHRRAWLAVPAVVTTFLFQHGVQGWCPPVPVFRRLGLRSRQEIETERYAVKLLRGDLVADDRASRDATARARKVLEAVTG